MDKEKGHWTKLPGNSKIRSKSADSSYSHKKVDIRNAFADEIRLARSSGKAPEQHFKLVVLTPLREES